MQDKQITVFGGSGFVGRYVVRALVERGARVRIASRDPSDAWFLKTQGGLGQTQFVAADIRRPETVARAIDGAHGVVNLVGILKGDFEAIQSEGAGNVAAAAARARARAFVHLSAIGADPASASAYGRSKGEGEATVRAAFPTATILRPSIVFGREDGFVNRFAQLIARLPVVPVIRGSVRFQPVYVGDVAKAVAVALGDPDAHGGKTYELGGPETISMAALNRRIAQGSARNPAFVPVPDGMAAAMARITGPLPGAAMTYDQWLMLQADNVVSDVDGLAALGIAPMPLEAVLDDMLLRYRPRGRFGAKAG